MTETFEPVAGILGVDIGGANLKYATADGRCLDRTFAMWERSHELAAQLSADIRHFQGVRRLAVTMTGELADCFLSRHAGVNYIVDQVMQSLPTSTIESAEFYGTDGRFRDDLSARVNWEYVAASNWHALASCVGTRIATNALLIDIGSTTTDVIAICNGQVLTDSRTDFERLADQSLVYVGCRRTPVCALVSELIVNRQPVPVMNELFATIDDARIWTGTQAEEAGDLATADSQPRDRPHARARLARMIGLDADQISCEALDDVAAQVIDAASKQINAAVSRWARRLRDETGQPPVFILSGHGQDLLLAPEGIRVIDLRRELPAGVSRSAPAWAVAVLHRGKYPAS
ncbi:hydantoinase/oxoprolinase family protein [Allorhodopirellula heiligendammensis]|nr:hydantoinase/oxoprolinase family protein [Allorhodopirellula heiligendammensis]